MKTKLQSLYQLLHEVEAGKAEIRAAIDALDEILLVSDSAEVLQPADFFIYFIEEIQKQKSVTDFVKLIIDVFYHRELISNQSIVFVSTPIGENRHRVMRAYHKNQELTSLEEKDTIFAHQDTSKYIHVQSRLSRDQAQKIEWEENSIITQLAKAHQLDYLYHISFYHLPNSNQKLTVNFLSANPLISSHVSQIELLLKIANSLPIQALTSLQTKYREDIINLAMDASPFVLLLFDEQGKLIKANDSTKKYFIADSINQFNLFNDFLADQENSKLLVEALNKGEILNLDQLNESLFNGNRIPDDFYEGRVMPIFYHSKTPSYYLAIFEFNKSRKEISTKLKREKEKYELIFYSIQDIYFEAQLDGIITEVSPSVFNHSGHTREEMIGTNVMNYYANTNIRQRYIDLLTSQGYVNNFEAQFLRMDGGTLTVLINSRLHKKNGDSQPCIIGSMTDITSYIKVKEALHSNQRKLNSVFDSAPFGIVTFDFMGNILDVNQRLLGFLGSPSANATKSLNIFKIPNMIDSGIVTHIQSAIESKQTNIIETEYKSQWNAVGYYKIYITPVINQLEKIDSILLMIEDITEKRAKDQELIDMQQRFKDIYENTNDLIYTMDFEGNFTSVNPVSEKILGYSFEKVSNLSMKNYITLDSFNRAKENIIQKLEGEKSKSNYEVVTFDKNGNRIVLEINSRLRYNEGKAIEVFGIGRDITERKKYEEELHMALKEKDLLIREIHHRVKNNLQLILSFIKMHAQKFDDVNIIESFNDIKRKILTISSFHEDLYFGKDMNSVNIKSYITTLIRNQYEMSRKKTHIHFENKIEDVVTNIDISIPLGLIVSELVSNATRYAFDGFEGDPIIKVSLFETPEGINLQVEDNGVGMSKSAKSGTLKSLGIQLVEVLVKDQLSGKINFTSSDHGTIFSIMIPGR